MNRTPIDPYLIPGTDTLRNRLGYTDPVRLAQVEHSVTALRGNQLERNPIKGNFDLDHLKGIHRATFDKVYDWAGEVRSIDLSKGGSTFTRVGQIEHKAQEISASLARENHLRDLEKPQFVNRLAHYQNQFNELHPFREGNGRATRTMVAQIAREAGYELDRTRIDQNRGIWNDASRKGIAGDLEPLKQIFQDAVRPSRAVAFETLKERDALEQHPELKGAYAALAAFRQSNEQKYPGNDKAQDHFNAQARTEIIRKLDAGRIVDPPIQRAAQLNAKGENSTTANSLTTSAASLQESNLRIDAVAKQLSLSVLDADLHGKPHKGEVVAVAPHHSLVKIGQAEGIKHENAQVSRPLTVGEKVAMGPVLEQSNQAARVQASEREANQILSR